MLVPRVWPRYVVEVEEYVYLAREEQEPDRLVEPDLAIVDTADDWTAEQAVAGGLALAVQPVVHTVPVPRRFRQAFLTIRTREFQEVVTVIEVLSPWNKTSGDGRTEYLVKRTNVFLTLAHLVELDLLHGVARKAASSRRSRSASASACRRIASDCCRAASFCCRAASFWSRAARASRRDSCGVGSQRSEAGS